MSRVLQLLLLSIIAVSAQFNRETDSLALLEIADANPSSRLTWRDSADAGASLDTWKRVYVRNNRIERIDIWNDNIDTLPAVIGNLSELDTLRIVSNELDSLPSSIGNLTGLVQFYTQGNGLTKFPSFIRNLTNLTFLHLGYEEIPSIPTWINELTLLDTVYIHGNPITTLPVELNDLSPNHLYIHRNFLDFTEISKITNVREKYYYAPQDTFGTVDTIPFTETTTLDNTIGGDGNAYTWYRNNIKIEGETGSSLTITKPGIYFSTVTNSNVPGLTIQNHTTAFVTGSRELDSLALIAMADLNPGLSSWHTDRDNNLPIDQWWGVTVKENRVAGISFNYRKVEQLPPEFGNLTHLGVLSADRSGLTALPDEIGKLHLLRGLYLKECNIRSIPESFSRLPLLHILHFHDNNMESIPEHMVHLPKSASLNLEGNLLTELPKSFDSLHINSLNIARNRLEFDQIERFKLRTGPQKGYHYHPQDTLGEYHKVYSDDPMVLFGKIGGSQNNYQWYKDGVALTDSTNDSITVSETGYYHCEVTSSVRSGLTIVQFGTDYRKYSRETDSLALVAIRDAMTNSGTFLRTWKDENSLDRWGYVNLNGDGRVNRLEFISTSVTFEGTLSEELGRITKLERLSLKMKGIPTLPQSINSLTLLEELALETESDSLFAIDSLSLRSLKKLSIANYTGDSLPIKFEEMGSLTSIYFNNIININDLPTSLADMTLTVLSLSSSPTITIPDWFEHLNVRALYLGNNGYSSIPPVLEKMQSVETIHLNKNELSSINIDITQMSKLRTLFLNNNKFTEIPAILYSGMLNHISLDANEITEFPEALLDNPNLYRLSLDSNKIETLPAKLGTGPLHLDNIYLKNNKIRELPTGFGDVVPFPYWLDLDDNLLTKLPEYIDTVRSWNSFAGNKFPLKEIERLRTVFQTKSERPSNWKAQLYRTRTGGPYETITVVEGEDVTLTCPIANEDEYTMGYQWNKGDRRISSNGYLPEKGFELTNVSKEDEGWYMVTAICSTLENFYFHSDSVEVKVVSKPEFTSGKAVDAIEDIRFSYKATTVDNGFPVTYRFSSLPSWLSADADSVYGTPADGDGDTTFTVTADNGHVDSSMTVFITVEDVPDTTIVGPYDSLVTVDSIRTDIDSVYSEKSDTVVTTIRITVKTDSTLTVIDTLIDGTFHNDSITVLVTVTETPIDTTVETFEYVPTLSENRRDTIITGYDTLVSVDSVYELQDTIVTTIRTQWVKDSLFTLIDSLSDDVIFWDTTILKGITNSSVPIDTTIDTLKEYMEEITTSHSIVKDTVTSIDSTVLANKDTVVTTVKTENWIDTLFTRTDSLYRGESFWFKVDTSVTSGSDVAATLLDTLKYQPTLAEQVTTSNVTVYDTVIAIDSTILPTEDTVVTTTKTENWIDSLFTRTDSLSDGVSFWFEVDTAVTSGSELLTPTTDTLYADQVELSTVNKRLVSPHFAAFPNPVPLSDREVLFVLSEGIAGSAQITVYDMLGNIIDQQDLVIAEQNDIRWDLTNRYGQLVSSGSYVAILRVTLNDGSTQLFKTAVGVKQ